MDIKRARIVVVEDESIMQTFILNSLRRLGILDLYAFKDAVSALAEIPRLKPDLILSDVHMQPMDGIAFVRALRASPDTAVNNLPVIFLSADSSAGTVAATLPLGVAGYIVKPPSLPALSTKIEQALRGYSTTIFN